jgi:hypothetical protein
MSRNLSVTEPHPSVPKSGGYIYGGRGGAGNYKRYKAEEITPGSTATGPASRISLSKSSKRQPVQHVGRGGVGNVYKAAETEERVFQFDEEMVKKREVQAPVYHIGRGGAGNYSGEQPRTERLNSSASAISSNSDDSSSEGNAAKTSGPFSKFVRRFS